VVFHLTIKVTDGIMPPEFHLLQACVSQHADPWMEHRRMLNYLLPVLPKYSVELNKPLVSSGYRSKADVTEARS